MDEFVCDQCSKIVSEPVEDEPYQICAECRAENNALRAQLDIAVKAHEEIVKLFRRGDWMDNLADIRMASQNALSEIAKLGGGK